MHFLERRAVIRHLLENVDLLNYTWKRMIGIECGRKWVLFGFMLGHALPKTEAVPSFQT